MAESITWGYGSAGTFGFRRPAVRDRWHNGAGHGYFLNQSFCEKFWVPFLRDGTIVDDDLQAERPSWLVSLISVVHLKFWLWPLLAALIAIASVQLNFVPRAVAAITGAPSELDKFAKTIRFGTTQQAVEASLGYPVISQIHRPALRYYRDLPSEADTKAAEAAAALLQTTLNLYRFEDFSAEVVYSEGRVIQYTIVNRSEEPLPLAQFADFTSNWGNSFDPQSSALGSIYFSELTDDCWSSYGQYSQDDAFFQLACSTSEAHGGVGLTFGWTTLGENFEPYVDQPEFAGTFGSYHGLGLRLLHSTGIETLEDCPPATGLQTIDEMIAALPDRSLERLDWRALFNDMQLLCFALRVTRPNAVTISDRELPSKEVQLSDGTSLWLQAGPSGLFAYDDYMGRHLAAF